MGFLVFRASCVAAERPLSVCEALSKLEQYRGKMVKITGVLVKSHRHGSYLEDLDIDVCREGKKGKGLPASIRLAWPSQQNLEDGPRDFQPDTEEIEKNLSEVERLTKSKDSLLIIATFWGQLRSRKGISIVHDKQNENWYGNGYGQMGMCAAQLVIKAVTDATVIESKSWKPRPPAARARR